MPNVFDASPDEHISFVIFKLVFGAALVVASPFMGYGIMKNFSEARSSTSWPATEATITRSEVVQDNSGGKIRFEPKISYSYTVDNQAYSSSQVAFRGFGTPIREHADELTATYPVGAKVQAYYNPQKPSSATLMTGANWLNYLFLTVPLMMLGGGGFMVKDHLQEFQRRQRAATAPRKSAKTSNPGKKKPTRRPRPIEDE